MFHLRAKVIGRSMGRSAGGAVAYRAGSKIAAATIAYRAGEKLSDPNTGRTFDYRAKGRIDANGYGVLHKEVLVPPDTPAWARDIQKLVNAVEAAEKRSDAQLFREIEVSFPRELGLEDQKALIRAYAERMFVREGMVAAIFIHNERASDGGDNPHAHILLTMRDIGPDGFGKKNRSWNVPSKAKEWREAWAEYANEFLKARGHEPRLDHRSHKERGLDVEPDTYVGPTKGRTFDGIIVAHRQSERDAGKARNLDRAMERPAWVLQQITRTHATFTERDIARFIHRYTALTNQDHRFAGLMAKVMQSPELQKLAEAEGQKPARYTTKAMFDCERRMMNAADRLATRSNAFIWLRDGLSGLSDEQAKAARDLLAGPDLSALHGLAGTGKTHLLAAVARQFSAVGFKVRGAALSGIVARNLSEGLGIEAQTIASLLRELSERSLAKGDVLIIDEAGMVGSRQLGAILEHAADAGAKVILVGDTRQLQSIEAGGAFRAIIERHGAAEVKTIRRQTNAWQRQASADLAHGRVGEALATYRAQGHLHAEATPEEAMDKLVTQWLADRSRGQSQLILAHRRSDAQALNRLARSKLRAQGHLGPNVSIDVTITEEKDGDLFNRSARRYFAVGDRLLFTRNDKVLGVQNGALATILGLSRDGQFRVRMDDGRELSFGASQYSHLEQGYALTVHKAQGATVDRSYVLAGEMFDAHMAYVAMTRHRERVDLFYNRVDFPTDAKLMRRFSRENLKDTTLDYSKAAPQTSLRTLAPRLEPTPPPHQETPRGKALWHPPTLDAFEVVLASDLPRVDPRVVTTGHWADLGAPDIAEQVRKRMRERDIGLGD